MNVINIPIRRALDGLDRDKSLLALLTRIAVRCDDLDGIAKGDAANAAIVRMDVAAIRKAADEARRLIVKEHLA